MIPLRDENPTRHFPAVTVAVIGVCVFIYFFVQPTGQGAFMTQDPATQQQEEIRFTLRNAAVPCELLTGEPLSRDEIISTFNLGDTTSCRRDDGTSPPEFPDKNVYLAVLYSMFLHGGFLHLAGNMLFLWVFGNNIEDNRGKVQFVVFYLLAGLAATAAHFLIEPQSSVPVVGASGAIAGVMGAYLVLFPNAQIRTLIIMFFILFRDISAKWLLGFWFISQFFISPGSGVAWAAHVGGFVFGVGAGLVWKAQRRGRSPDRQWQVSY